MYMAEICFYCFKILVCNFEQIFVFCFQTALGFRKRRKHCLINDRLDNEFTNVRTFVFYFEGLYCRRKKRIFNQALYELVFIAIRCVCTYTKNLIKINVYIHTYKDRIDKLEGRSYTQTYTHACQNNILYFSVIQIFRRLFFEICSALVQLFLLLNKHNSLQNCAAISYCLYPRLPNIQNREKKQRIMYTLLKKLSLFKKLSCLLSNLIKSWFFF